VATYFDSTQATDKNLLPPEFRSAADLANVAADVEKDVIGHYTEHGRDTLFRASRDFSQPGEQVNENLSLWVRLRGYKADAAHADVDPDLRDALKRTIADVITWRLRQHNADPLMASESSDQRSKTWRDSAVYTFPRSWDRRLRNFDLTEPVWGG
jgi:hypothetical protein